MEEYVDLCQYMVIGVCMFELDSLIYASFFAEIMIITEVCLLRLNGFSIANEPFDCN